jgi:hypothetical protein
MQIPVLIASKSKLLSSICARWLPSACVGFVIGWLLHANGHILLDEISVGALLLAGIYAALTTSRFLSALTVVFRVYLFMISADAAYFLHKTLD